MIFQNIFIALFYNQDGKVTRFHLFKSEEDEAEILHFFEQNLEQRIAVFWLEFQHAHHLTTNFQHIKIVQDFVGTDKAIFAVDGQKEHQFWDQWEASYFKFWNTQITQYIH